MDQFVTKNERFGDFFEGLVPVLLETKQKAGWLVPIGMKCLVGWWDLAEAPHVKKMRAHSTILSWVTTRLQSA